MTESRPHSTSGRHVAVTVRVVSVLFTVSACTPSWQIRPGVRSESPAVRDVVENINRQIACAIVTSLKPEDITGLSGKRAQEVAESNKLEKAAWDRFDDSEAVASVALTLQVTHTEGLNPSVSFITPYNPIGKSTMSTTSGAWNLGVQLNGTQQRQLVINYALDAAALKAAVKKNSIQCDSDGRPASNYTILDRELSGDLGIRETIAAEIVGLAHASDYSIKRLKNTASPYIYKPPTTSFVVQSQFVVTEGLNGGPNFKLLNFSGPSGGGGGGSGGGAGATGGGTMGGSGSGGGSGGGGQLLNFNRSTMDQLIVTITPTCDEEGNTAWAVQSNCLDSPEIKDAKARLRRSTDLAATADQLTRNLSEELLLPRSKKKSVATAEIDRRKADAAKAEQQMNADQAQLDRLLSAASVAKANAAAYGASANLLYRLGISSLNSEAQ